MLLPKSTDQSSSLFDPKESNFFCAHLKTFMAKSIQSLTFLQKPQILKTHFADFTKTKQKHDQIDSTTYPSSLPNFSSLRLESLKLRSISVAFADLSFGFQSCLENPMEHCRLSKLRQINREDEQLLPIGFDSNRNPSSSSSQANI